ncbi:MULTISPECIES: trigger factor [Kitasatospora]|uniref:Trigger factor n=1 Tax=Kitasatospora setae (strain ATCC 33774 / DSM 43861 / JCM 3304 / KCC A-0304 / NBRC 14216 / KM-6054) TaxID=452652 RepID=E4NB60_KITSK|nr:trigger factor [Kitasatospora setae]BAJ28441.1 putative trigger factor [Kitasatospora setae KM-6054]
MKSAVETLNPTRVRLIVEVPFEELKPSLDAAYKKINQQVTVPGFRKGKIPNKVIDQRFGRGAVLEEAVNDALPRFYTQAVDEGQIDVLGQPDITEIEGVENLADGGDLKFTAEVDVRPEVTLPEFAEIAVVVDPIEVSDEDVEKSLEQLRERFASVKDVERAATENDIVVIDLEAKVDGEVPEDGTATGVSYEIGSGRLLDGIDEAVVGLSAGESKTFTTTLKGGTQVGKDSEVTVTVTAVQEKELPELDDEFAQLASEFDTLEELRADSVKRLERMKEFDQATQAQEKVLDELLSRVELDYPEKLLADEIGTRKHNLEHHQLEPMGLTLDTYLASQDKSHEDYEKETEEQAKKGIKTQFVLDQIVKNEELGVNQEELTEHLIRRAAGSGLTPDQFAQQVVQGGQVQLLVGEVARGKALALVVEAAKVTDTNGETVSFEDEEETTEAAGTTDAAAEATEESAEA